MRVRSLDLAADRSAVIDLLRRNRSSGPPCDLEARYDWLYLKNPHGQAVGWVAEDQAKGPIGFTVALPRIMQVGGELLVGWNCADFSIDVAFRTLGVAVQLRRAARQAVDTGIPPFLYAHPNNRMLVVHRRVGHTVLGEMRRYARPLLVDHRFGALRPRMLRRPLAGMANALLRVVDLGTQHPKTVSVTESGPCFGEEFTEFSSQVARRYGVWGVRDAGYLHWRYSENPVERCTLLTTRERNGALRGFLVCAVAEPLLLIKDLVASDPDAAGALVAAACRVGRARRVGAVSFNLVTWSEYVPLLRRLGFRERPDSQSSVVVHVADSCAQRDRILDHTQWFMTVGDRDI